MKKPSIILSSIAGFIGALIAAIVTGHFMSGGFDKVMMNVASDMNKTLPIMVDKATRLDNTIAGPGNKFSYFFSLVEFAKADVDIEHFRQKMRPKLIAAYRSSPQMKSFRDHNVVLDYQYRDKAGEFICNLVITTKDF